ncbi:MAG: Bacterial antitoxin of ParD toxin-antitoxin type system [Thermomicrobiales bacterium]|jgi:Arc/MetJ-type ribon-helix-helix transcriptional regulator|nr:Bacterial antitoxin of ParD toxin-antitoxin type system [Microvirga sp.]MDF3041591.1 Bacterial antitoxin of ParD toxin-antitoxin type system [Thermomicrobiales bacterium]
MVNHLSPEAEARVRTLMESGGYDSPETIINEALRVLEERDQYARLKAAIAVGIEPFERAKSSPGHPMLLIG